MALIAKQLIRNLSKNGINVRGHSSLLSNRILNENSNKYKFPQNVSRRNVGAYEGDGKTTMTLLNNEKDLGLMINSYSQLGFRLNNNVFVLGPMAIFPRTVLSWNVDTLEDINDQSLRLVSLLDPKIDILILGVGDIDVTPSLSKQILQFMKKYKINIEVLKTEQACSTFNFLNAENRMVAALLIPPLHLRINEDDLMRRTDRGNYFKIEGDDEDPFRDLKKIK